MNINNIFYFDETSIDLNIQKQYGYGNKSKRLLFDKIGQRFYVRRITVLSCINNNNRYVAPFYFEGNTDALLFKEYSKQILIPELKRIKKYKLITKQVKLHERLTIILDNASFHKNKDIEELFNKNRINLLYLPPYSPDFNPIEKKWAQLKAKYKKYKDMWIYNIKDKMDSYIKLIDRLLKVGC